MRFPIPLVLLAHASPVVIGPRNSHEESRICHQMRNIRISLPNSLIARYIEAQQPTEAAYERETERRNCDLSAGSHR
jgi:hypothetical protein